MINTSKIVGGSFPDLPKLQPHKYGRRNDGRYASIPYACLTPSQIDMLAVQCDAAGLNYEVTHGFGSRSEIVWEYNFNFVNNSFNGPQTDSEDTWEIVPQKAMKDLLDSRNPLVMAANSETSNYGVQVLLLKNWKRQNLLEQNLCNTDGTFKIPAIPSTTGGAATPFGNNGIVLAKFLYDGVENVEIPVPVLTHTKTVTAQYIYPAQFTNIGRIFSSATLITTESIPTSVLWDFPNDSDPGPMPISGTTLFQAFLYGWLKNSPSVRQVANQKWNITQTYDYGLWAMQLYKSIRL